MPQNAFAISDKTYNKPNRNAFPLSHAVNFTTKFGDIIPVFCKPVYSGDSFRIRPAFGLQFMPMIFPIQSRIRAKLSFFYVRKRNLWKDYMDFYGKTKDNLVPPYIECNSAQMDHMFRLSQLADNFGIPVTAYGEFSQIKSMDIKFVKYNGDSSILGQFNHSFQLVGPNNLTTPFTSSDLHANIGLVGKQTEVNSLSNLKNMDLNKFYIPFTFSVTGNDTSNIGVCVVFHVIKNGVSYYYIGSASGDAYSDGKISVKDCSYVKFENSLYSDVEFSDVVSDIKYIDSIICGLDLSTSSNYTVNSFVLDNYTYREESETKYNFTSIVDNPDVNPYGVGEGKQKLSAMPFRAYEQIYNVYYRNSKNNPLIINGVTEYNKICRTVDGGADSYVYDVKKHNWELDFLTSAVQSPQQGVAPLVGITATGQMTFQDTEGNIFKAQADIDDDGTIKGFKIGETGLPQGTLRSLVDTVSSGISINDLRNVNSFQRWLETNMRRGMRYVDQVKSHFGVDVDYNAMEYPEFIGGFSRDVDINTILNQTSGAAPLGEMGGLARVSGSSQHDISKYISENGYIIGLLTVIPIPTYSQILPKHFLLNSVFDEYFPEFGKIGMQPILMSEVAPIQQYMSDPTKMNQVFGYQRPWYDLLGAVDEVHGEYRTTLRDYLINRVFNTPPELGEEFLLVDDSQVNSVFAETKNDHAKILGQIVFNVDAKRPIPLFGVPSLE